MTNSSEDYVVPSIKVPLAPGFGVALAEGGNGTATDNHGNQLSGHELYFRTHGEVHHYHLSDKQWNKLCDLLEPSSTASVRQMRKDNKVPIIDNQGKSPLQFLGEALEAEGAPYTPILPKTSPQKTPPRK